MQALLVEVLDVLGVKLLRLLVRLRDTYELQEAGAVGVIVGA